MQITIFTLRYHGKAKAYSVMLLPVKIQLLRRVAASATTYCYELRHAANLYSMLQEIHRVATNAILVCYELLLHFF